MKEDVLAHIERNGGDGAAARTKPRPALAEPKLTPIRGGDAVLARFMKESLEIPTATSFRTLEVDTLDRRRRQLNETLKAAQRDMKVSFTHLIGYAIAVAVRDHPAMGHSFAEVDGKPQRIVHEYVNLGLAVDVQRKDGARTLIVPVIKGADSMDFASFREVYEDLIAKTRDGSLSPDDLQGANITLTNPGGIGTIASVPRLMPGQGTIVATGSIALPPGLRGLDKTRIAELGMSKVMTMTSTYDHRVIQGAESGAFLRRIEELLHGADRFYEDVFRSFGLETPAAPVAEPVAPKPTARAVRGDARPRAGRHVAGQGAPHARASRGAARPARLRAGRRPGARAGDRGADPGDHGADSRAHPAHPGAGRDARRGPPPPARDLLRHDRLRDRAHLRPPAARVAAQPDRVGQVPPPAVARGEEAHAFAPDQGGGARGLPAPRVHRGEELLDRGPRRRWSRCSTSHSRSPPTPACATSSWAWRTAGG